MSIKSELHTIQIELDSIRESQERINTYRQELNKFNPFKVGEKLIGNGWTHEGKPFEVSETFVSDKPHDAFKHNPVSMPKYFLARGKIIKKDGSLSIYETTRSIKMSEVTDSE